MKTNSSRAMGRSSRSGTARAFTLPELMIVIAIFMILVGAVITCQLFGMRLHRIAETKLASTWTGRKALNHIRDEVRGGKMLVVGLGSQTAFSKIADNLPQEGNALQIYPTTDTNDFIRYYLDVPSQTLRRVTSDNAEPEIVASFITNRLVFRAEDFLGRPLTNDQNNRVIRMVLEFYRWEYPIACAGKGAMYDYYRLQTRITRRTID